MGRLVLKLYRTVERKAQLAIETPLGEELVTLIRPGSGELRGNVQSL